MPVRHNTGGEFPSGSGKKWLGIQFNNNDVLVNVYGGKYQDQNGKKRTQRFYGGRFKTMRPALQSVIRTLEKKIGSRKFAAYEDKWGLQEKLERARAQLKIYPKEVTQDEEARGLRQLNITSRKRKAKNSRRLQSTHPKKKYGMMKQEVYVNSNSGTLSSTTPSGMYINNNIIHKAEETNTMMVPVEEGKATSTSIVVVNNNNNNHQQQIMTTSVTNQNKEVSGGATFVVPASMTKQTSLNFDEEIKFPLMPPESPNYWGDADGGASEASMSRSCSPFYTPEPADEAYTESGLGSLIPPKICNTDELRPAIRPLYDDFGDWVDTNLESESSDMNMEAPEDFINSLAVLRGSCFNCRVLRSTCAKCQDRERQSSPFGLTNKDMTEGYTFPTGMFDGKPFMDPEVFPAMSSESDLLAEDSDEEMIDVSIKVEPTRNDTNELWTSDFPQLQL